MALPNGQRRRDLGDAGECATAAGCSTEGNWTEWRASIGEVLSGIRGTELEAFKESCGNRSTGAMNR